MCYSGGKKGFFIDKTEGNNYSVFKGANSLILWLSDRSQSHCLFPHLHVNGKKIVLNSYTSGIGLVLCASQL